MNLWKRLNLLSITKKLTFGQDATIEVTNATDGSISTLSASEFAVLDGLLSTAAELNRSSDVSTRLVNTTATTLACTIAAHEGKVVTINSAAPIAVTLPGATGSGAKFTFVVGTVATATAHTIGTGTTTANFAGVSVIQSTATNDVMGYATTATDNTISLNGTTKGGYPGLVIEIVDIATDVFTVQMTPKVTGTIVTPFSHV